MERESGMVWIDSGEKFPLKMQNHDGTSQHLGMEMTEADLRTGWAHGLAELSRIAFKRRNTPHVLTVVTVSLVGFMPMEVF
jgi:hypothetical protein